MLKSTYWGGRMKRKLVLHPYTPAMVNHVERWLTKMSCDGWKLVHKNGWKFYFLRSQKRPRQYFMYSGFDASQGISYEYHRAKDIYAESKAEINKRTDGIFEVSSCKIDSKFYYYRMIRNKYYRNHYVKLAIFSLIFIVLSLVGSFNNLFFVVVGVPFLITFIYAITSILIVSRFIKQ